MSRVLITGWPKAGKTTMALDAGGTVRHTDDVMHLGWSEASEEVSTWFDEPGPWTIEGVAVPRALRKWQRRNPGKAPPVDRLIVLREPHEQLNAGQITMGRGIDSVLSELVVWAADVMEEA